MIYSVAGKIGHGKGCVLTMLARRQADKGRAVYSNWPIYDSRIIYIETWAEVCDLDNADVFLDELHLWFGSRDYNKKEGGEYRRSDDLLRWSQSRHDGLNIYWSSQNPSQVDIQVREVFTHFVYKVKRIAGPNEDGEPSRVEQALGAWAVINKYDAAEYRLATKRVSLWRRWLRLNEMWGLYDTHHIIGFKDGTGVREGRGRLPSVRGSAPTSRILTAKAYDDGRYVDPHHPGRVYWFPEVGDAIQRKDNLRGQTVGEVRGPGNGFGGDGRGGVVGGPQDADNGASLGFPHRPRLQFGKLNKGGELVQPLAPTIGSLAND